MSSQQGLRLESADSDDEDDDLDDELSMYLTASDPVVKSKSINERKVNERETMHENADKKEPFDEKDEDKKNDVQTLQRDSPPVKAEDSEIEVSKDEFIKSNRSTVSELQDNNQLVMADYQKDSKDSVARIDISDLENHAGSIEDNTIQENENIDMSEKEILIDSENEFAKHLSAQKVNEELQDDNQVLVADYLKDSQDKENSDATDHEKHVGSIEDKTIQENENIDMSEKEILIDSDDEFAKHLSAGKVNQELQEDNQVLVADYLKDSQDKENSDATTHISDHEKHVGSIDDNTIQTIENIDMSEKEILIDSDDEFAKHLSAGKVNQELQDNNQLVVADYQKDSKDKENSDATDHEKHVGSIEDQTIQENENIDMSEKEILNDSDHEFAIYLSAGKVNQELQDNNQVLVADYLKDSQDKENSDATTHISDREKRVGSIDDNTIQTTENIDMSEKEILNDSDDEFAIYLSAGKINQELQDNNQVVMSDCLKNSQDKKNSDATVDISDHEKHVGSIDDNTIQENENIYTSEKGILNDSDDEFAMYLSAGKVNQNVENVICLEPATIEKSTNKNVDEKCKEEIQQLPADKNEVVTKTVITKTGNTATIVYSDVPDSIQIFSNDRNGMNNIEDTVSENMNEDKNNNGCVSVGNSNFDADLINDESDDELSAYLKTAEKPQVSIQNNRTDINLLCQKAESHRTDSIISDSSPNHQESNIINNKTEGNIIIIGEKEAKNMQQVKPEASDDLMPRNLVNGTHLENLESPKAQTIETDYRLIHVNEISNNFHSKPSNKDITKHSVVRPRDVETLEKMIHYSTEGFSDQIIIQSPTKTVNNANDVQPKKERSMVEITIIDADETDSCEETRENITVTESTYEKEVSSDTVKLVNKKIENNQMNMPTKSEEKDLNADMIITKQTNENNSGTKYLYKKNEKDKCTALHETLKKTEIFEPLNLGEPAPSKVSAGKFIRKNNKLFLMSVINGKPVEKEFVKSSQKAEVQMQHSKDTSISEIVTKDNVSGIRPTKCNQPTLEGKAHMEKKLLGQGNAGLTKKSQVTKKVEKINPDFHCRTQNARKPLHEALQAKCINQVTKTSTVIDLTEDLTVHSTDNEDEVTKTEERPPKTNQSEIQMLTESGKELCETNKINIDEERKDCEGGEKLHSKHVLKCEGTESTKLPSVAFSSSLQNKIPYAVIDQGCLNKDIDKTNFEAKHGDETLGNGDSGAEFMIESENNTKKEKESQILKDKATIRVFRVEQSPSKAGTHLAKFIILRDDGRYHEIDNVEIDGDISKCSTGVTAVPLDRNTRDENSTSKLRKGLSSGTCGGFDVKDQTSPFLDAAEQSHVTCCTCKCSCKVSPSGDKENQHQKQQSNENPEARVSVKRKLVLNEKAKESVNSSTALVSDYTQLKNKIDDNTYTVTQLDLDEKQQKIKKFKKTRHSKGSSKSTHAKDKLTELIDTQMEGEDSFHTDGASDNDSNLLKTSNREKKGNNLESRNKPVNDSDENLNLVGGTSYLMSKRAVLKLSKQVELMRLIGKNKKEASYVTKSERTRNRIHVVISKSDEKMNTPVNMSQKLQDINYESKSGLKSEIRGNENHKRNKSEKRADELSNSVPASTQQVKRKLTENLCSEITAESQLISNKEIHDLGRESSAYVPKRARLKAEFSSTGERELKNLKIDMKQQIVNQPSELSGSFADSIDTKTKWTRQKVKSSEVNLEKQNVANVYQNFVDNKTEFSKFEKSQKDKKLCKQMSVKSKKSHKSVCKRELDNLFIDMVVGNTNFESRTNTKMTPSESKARHEARCQSGSQFLDNKMEQQSASDNKRKVIKEEMKHESPESRTLKNAKRSLGEGLSPIKKAGIRICDDFIPDISTAMEECLRLVKERERVLTEEKYNKIETEQKLATERNAFENKDENEAVNLAEEKLTFQEESKSLSNFDIERHICEVCGKFVTVYSTKTGLLCYVSEKQQVNIEDNEQQLCEGCGSIDDTGSVKAHYVLQEKNLRTDANHEIKQKTSDETKVDNTIYSVSEISPKGKKAKTKQKKEKSSKQLKVRFTEPTNSHEKEKPSEKRKNINRLENSDEIIKRRTTKNSIEYIGLTKESEDGSSLSFKKQEQCSQYGMNKQQQLLNTANAKTEEKISRNGNLRSCARMKMFGYRLKREESKRTCLLAGKLKSKALKHTRKGRFKGRGESRPAKKNRRLRRDFWKNYLRDGAFDFQSVIRDEKQKPDVKHVKRLLHRVLSSGSDTETERQKQHRREKKDKLEKKERKAKRIDRLPKVLISPIERPKYQFHKFEFFTQISCSENDTDTEGPVKSTQNPGPVYSMAGDTASQFVYVLDPNIVETVSPETTRIAQNDSTETVSGTPDNSFLDSEHSLSDSSDIKEYIAEKICFDPPHN